MGRFLSQMLEQDAPVGGGQPAGDPDLCFDPITGEQVRCPEAGATNAGADAPMTGGAPQNQDHGPVPEGEDKGGDGEVEPDKDGACPEGYTKGDDGKCQRGDDKGDGEKKEEVMEDDDKDDDKDDKKKYPWDKDDDDDSDDDDKDDDDSDDDDKKDKKDESKLLYRSAIADMVKQVMEGGKPRDIIAAAFGRK